MIFSVLFLRNVSYIETDGQTFAEVYLFLLKTWYHWLNAEETLEYY